MRCPELVKCVEGIRLSSTRGKRGGSCLSAESQERYSRDSTTARRGTIRDHFTRFHAYTAKIAVTPLDEIDNITVCGAFLRVLYTALTKEGPVWGFLLEDRNDGC